MKRLGIARKGTLTTSFVAANPLIWSVRLPEALRCRV